MAPPRPAPPPDDYPDDDGFDPAEWDGEPVGSCDNCGCNLYADDEWDGLCNQCAWWAAQGEAE